MDNIYFNLAVVHGASVLFRFGDTVAGKLTSLVSELRMQWYNSSNDQANTSIAAAAELWNGLGMLKLPGNIYARFPSMGLPQGAAGRTYEIIFRIPDGAQGIGSPVQWQTLFFGGNDTRAGQIIAFYPDLAQSVQVSLYGDFFSFDFAINRGKFYVLTVTVDAVGKCTLFVDGTKIQSKNFAGAPSTGTAQAYFNVHGSTDYVGQIIDYVGFGVWCRVNTDDEILARHQAAMAKWKVAGVAALDTGAKASKVLVRDWATHRTLADATLASDGSWGVYTPQGDFEVVALGPAGYRPVCDGPVTAVAV